MSASPSETSIVFVPGMASVGSVVYEPLVKSLTDLGHPPDAFRVINNHSVVDDLTNAPHINGSALSMDIDQIKTVLQDFVVDQHRDVLLVAHSYGGTPALYGAAGLWKHQRAAAGQDGGVVRIALIASSLTLPGGSVATDRAEWQVANDVPVDQVAAMETVNGETYLIPTGFETVWMNDITDATFRASLRPAALSSAVALTPTTDVGAPKHWRLAYLILTDLDLAMPEALQRHLIDRARSAGAEVDERTMRSGHFAQISHAKEVAGWLRGLL